MNSDLTEADRRLEAAIDAALCELPLRPAPPSLELHVLEELSRRAALPWWRHSFAGWPGFARVGFVLMCVVLVGLAFLGGVWAMQNLGSPALGALSMPWARHAGRARGRRGRARFAGAHRAARLGLRGAGGERRAVRGTVRLRDSRLPNAVSRSEFAGELTS